MARALRKFSIGFILVALFANMITCVSGRANITNYIIIIVNSICLAILIKQKVEFNKLLRDYKELLGYFKNLHAQRYYCCFSGTQEEVDKCTELIETVADQIVSMSKYFTNHVCSSKRQIKEVEYIVQQTEKLRKTMQPPM